MVNDQEFDIPIIAIIRRPTVLIPNRVNEKEDTGITTSKADSAILLWVVAFLCTKQDFNVTLQLDFYDLISTSKNVKTTPKPEKGFVGSVAEWFEASFCGGHDRMVNGSTPTQALLLRPWMRCFTIISARWNLTSSKLKSDAKFKRKTRKQRQLLSESGIWIRLS